MVAVNLAYNVQRRQDDITTDPPNRIKNYVAFLIPAESIYGGLSVSDSLNFAIGPTEDIVNQIFESIDDALDWFLNDKVFGTGPNGAAEQMIYLINEYTEGGFTLGEVKNYIDNVVNETITDLAERGLEAEVMDMLTAGGLDELKDAMAMEVEEISGLETALGAKLNASEKGAASGVAPLDSGSKVPSAYLPSYVDDVLEFANFAALPGTGETGKIYITTNDNKEFRWSGSTYVAIVASPGTTDNVPEGTTNLYHTAARVRAVVLTGLSLVTNAVIDASDTVLSAIGKLQAQITANKTRTKSNFTLAVSNPATANTGTQVDASKESIVRVTYSTQITYSLAGAPVSGVILKSCPTNSATEGDWIEEGRTEVAQPTGLSVTIGQVVKNTGQITADITAGHYVKAFPYGTGTHTEAFVSGRKTIIG